MNRQNGFLSGLVALLLGACGPLAAQTPVPAASATPPPAATTTVPPTIAPTFRPFPTPTAMVAVCKAGPDETWVAVDAKANLFGAGLDAAPAPGGGGGGVVPPVVPLPSGGTRLVTFPCTGGLTDFAGGPPSLGPEGFVGLQTTDVESFGGIAGMLLEGQVMFLAGVFITSDVPAAPAPDRLDFTDNVDFERLEPGLGQTFFIGDGAGQTFVAPAGATRLYLGFVDGYVFTGKPGWYGNNPGALEATVAITVE